MKQLLQIKEQENIIFEGSPRKLFEAEMMTEYFS